MIEEIIEDARKSGTRIFFCVVGSILVVAGVFGISFSAVAGMFWTVSEAGGVPLYLGAGALALFFVSLGVVAAGSFFMGVFNALHERFW